MHQQLCPSRGAVKAPQNSLVLLQLTPRSLHRTCQRKAARTASLVAHIAAEPRQILVTTPQQLQNSPTASLSYTSFEDDSLQSIIQLKDVCLDQEVARLGQLMQDMTSNCSSIADKVS
jgi:hypothetical protein